MSKSVAIIGTRGYPSYYGGFETAVRRIAPYLADEQWSVTVFGRKGATKKEEADPRIETIETLGLETKSLSTLSYGLTSVIATSFRRPSVALIMNVANGFWLPILKLRGIPTVVNVDGIEWDRAKWGRIAKFMFKTGARFTARYADALVADSHEIQRRWETEFGVGSHFIPYGGDVPGELPVHQGLEHRGYVLFVARFVPENTTREFLQAARDIARHYPVVIVGSSGYGGEFDVLAEELNNDCPNVKWLGHISDDKVLHGLWQHAGVYFHGHSVGGTNPALVQAMACASPIVARDTVYNREVLDDAAIYSTPSSKDIAAKCLELMAESTAQESLGASAFARSRLLYSWEAVCSAYAQVLLKYMKV